MGLTYYPAPCCERRAADNGDTTVATIGLVRNERSRSLSREDQGGCCQVPRCISCCHRCCLCFHRRRGCLLFAGWLLRRCLRLLSSRLCLCLSTRNLGLLRPHCLLSAGASPPICLLFARIAPADAIVIDFGIKLKLWPCEIAFQS